MAALTTQSLGQFLLDLRDTAAAALSPEPSRISLYPGTEVSFDMCCDGGQAWSRLDTLEPRIGRTLGNGTPCLVGYTATIEVGVLRCAAVIDDEGMPPSTGALDADALQEVADMAMIEESIRCAGWPVTFIGWAPLGVDGGCVGGAWMMTAIVDLCECPS